MTRLKKSKKVMCNQKLDYLEEDLRFGTPQLIAEYRAERLTCDILLEIGAGVGFQTVEFSKKCKKVYAVEIDPKKFSTLTRNIKKLRLKNVIAINANGLTQEVVNKAGDADIVFVDTERLPSEKERSLETLSPNIKKLLEAYPNCRGICIEVPPQIDQISLDCEKEYISLYGQLNRLNLYFGKLKSCEKKVVALPEGEILETNEAIELNKSQNILDYIYEINPAVIKANMIREASEGKAALYSFKNKKYLTSNKLIESAFLKTFKVIKKCEQQNLVKELKKLKAGKIILRGVIPEGQFREETMQIEKKLEGKLVYQIFALNEEIICEAL